MGLTPYPYLLGQTSSLLHQQLLDQTDKELRELKMVFADFLDRIRTENPDVLVFLDKGARVFGTPFLKYLKWLERAGKIKKAPQVRFYNDQTLKRGTPIFNEGWTSFSDQFRDRVENDFDWITSDTRVFFVDEAFHYGEWYYAIAAMAKVLKNSNISYFSFARTETGNALNEPLESPFNYKIPFVAYPIVTDRLFSKEIAERFFSDRAVYSHKFIDDYGRIFSVHRTVTARYAQEEEGNFHDIYAAVHDRILGALEDVDVASQVRQAAE